MARGREPGQQWMPALLDIEERMLSTLRLRHIEAISDRVPAIRKTAFDGMCAEHGRPSINPNACSTRGP